MGAHLIHAWRSGALSPRIGLTATLLLALLPANASPQTVQVAPFGGYRFGGDLYEDITGTALDIDGAPSLGVAVDVFVDRGLSFTFIYSHQEADIDVPAPGRNPQRVSLAIDHWHGGGTQEFGHGAVRPFYGGSLGLTRFGGSEDSEVRFSLAGGGGVKLMPSRHLGARLDGRVYAVFVDGAATTGVCTPGVCFIGLDVSVVWQAEFTAGLVVSF
jgi:hypothetical protein